MEFRAESLASHLRCRVLRVKGVTMALNNNGRLLAEVPLFVPKMGIGHWTETLNILFKPKYQFFKSFSTIILL